jgi:S1-C subfamily serine protease
MFMQDYSGYGQPPSGGGGGYGGYGYTSPLPPMPPPRPPRRRAGLLSHLLVALLAGALGAGLVVALGNPASNSSAAPSGGAATPVPLPSNAVPQPGSGGNAGTGTGSGSGVSGVVSKVEPGIVIINTTLQYNSEQAAGTGMVINPDGLVLTNNHVIESSTKITATVVSTGRTYPAKVIGYDVTGDIALIQLQDASGLHTVPLGNSSGLRVNDSVVAMGNAQGQSMIVPAPGQVTGLNKTITASDQGGVVSSETLHGMIQTNADIVSGDSGGPLANASGQVIGMDTAGNDVRFPDQQSAAGFAIPINTALAVAHQIAAGQASSTISIGYPPFIGIYIGQGTSSSPQAQAQQQENGNGGFGGGFGGSSGGNSCVTSNSNLGVPSTIAPVSSGTLIIGVICSSPAASAGLTPGSVITSVNGQAIGSPSSLTGTVGKYHPGDTISVTWVSPAGQHHTTNLTLQPGPPL